MDSRTASKPPAAEFESGSLNLNHVSIVVSNLERSIEFYRCVFGLSVDTEDKTNELVPLKLGSPGSGDRQSGGMMPVAFT